MSNNNEAGLYRRTLTKLSSQDSYHFSFKYGENINRFILHFNDATAIDNIENENRSTYYPNGSVYISAKETEITKGFKLLIWQDKSLKQNH